MTHPRFTQSEPQMEPTTLTIGESFIDKLTFDVLYKIFWHANGEQSVTGNQELPVIISHVCRQWRQYIFDIPTMWSVINFKSRGRDEDWARQIAYLERSKSAPLDITIWSDLHQDTYLGTARIMGVLRLVKPHIHRWKAIHIHLHPKGFRLFTDPLRVAAAPALETLDVNMWPGWTLGTKWRCRIFNGEFPNLRFLKTDIQQLPPMSTIPSMDKLRVLRITDVMRRSEKSHQFKVDEVLYILSKCINIEHLSIVLRSSLDPTPRALTIPTPISLPHLVSCEINSNDMWWGVTSAPYLPILKRIKAPSVRVLDSGPIVNSTIPIIATSNPFPNLEILTLIDKSWWNTDTVFDQYGLSTLQSAFSNLPLLSSLVLLQQSQISYLFRILKATCPRLTHLTLERCKFLPSECIAMVEARASSQAMSSLKHLSVTGLANDRRFSEDDQLSLRAILPEFVYTPPT
ncbi:hypothetical protein FRC03_011484 [Tulasnella sp. 419]|nr:hypothetical protein FRC03_011484 [Tulasnella sp. 419]